MLGTVTSRTRQAADAPTNPRARCVAPAAQVCAQPLIARKGPRREDAAAEQRCRYREPRSGARTLASRAPCPLCTSLPLS